MVQGRKTPNSQQRPWIEEKMLGVQGGKRWQEFAGQSTWEETERTLGTAECPLEYSAEDWSIFICGLLPQVSQLKCVSTQQPLPLLCFVFFICILRNYLLRFCFVHYLFPTLNLLNPQMKIEVCCISHTYNTILYWIGHRHLICIW